MYDHTSSSRHGSSRSSAPNSSTPAAQKIPYRTSPRSISGRDHDVPPPLPPPRHLPGITPQTLRPSVRGNPQSKGETGDTGMASVSPKSSLARGWNRPPQLERREPDSCRGSFPAIWSPNGSDTYDLKPQGRTEPSYSIGFKDEGYSSLSGSSLSGTSLIHRLQGERPLEKRNRQDSSNAYDSQLILRIGRQKTPPQAGEASSQEELPLVRTSFSHPSTKMEPSDRASNPILDSPLRSDSVRSWAASPPTSTSSPALVSFAAGATRVLAAQKSPPPAEHWPSHRSFGLRNEEYGMGRHASRRTGSDGSILISGFDDGPNPIRREKRVGSYDQNIFAADFDSEFSSEETGGMRHLHLDDRSPPVIDVYSPDSRLGMKRKASPLQDTPQHDDRFGGAGASTSEIYQRRTSGHLPPPLASPKNRYHPTIGSVSSASSSGLRNGSYASSAALSVAGSSITSMSSYEQRVSPGVSPLSEFHESNREQPALIALHRGQCPPFPLSRLDAVADIASNPEIPRKMSTEGIKAKLHEPPKLQSNLHICVCCPKKPKKFNTQAELSQHESEKQYKCAYCENRFKNKNEAERHQNSLHLRRHSWSCATLSNSYMEAFHPCTAVPPNTNPSHAPPPAPDSAIATADICGYCGMEFPNHPAPDWEARVNHLTNNHKFGECNQSKKFFRADHFRQHLKHSHSGTSGKWTNMLEAACMQEEPPLTPEALGLEQSRNQHQQQKQYQQQQAQAAQQAQAVQQVQQLQQEQQAHQGAPVARMMGGPPPPLRPTNYLGMPLPTGNEMHFAKIEEEEM